MDLCILKCSNFIYVVLFTSWLVIYRKYHNLFFKLFFNFVFHQKVTKSNYNLMDRSYEWSHKMELQMELQEAITIWSIFAF